MHTKDYIKNSQDNMIPKLTGRDIICISSMPYHGMWTRKQRLMTLLAEKGNRVLYVEPANPVIGKQGDKGRLRCEVERVSENLNLIKPVGRFPLARFGFIRELNLSLYANSIMRTAMEFGLDDPIIFTYLPVLNAHSPFSKLLNLLRDLAPSLVIYDCVDEHSETIGYSSEAAELVHRWDIELTEDADIVFVTAQGLYNDRKTYNPNLHYSPNGVDVAHFSKARLKTTEIPSDLAAISEPRIGFVGSLSDWIDYELISEVAKRYPDYNIVLVGPVKRGMDIPELRNLPNVYLLGKKSPDELPRYLKGFDCAINPFKRVGITEKVNPLKVYEYLAAGVPVVSINMPEIMHLEDAIYIAHNDGEFLEGVDMIIKKQFNPDERKIKTVLENHDWNKIFNDLVERVAELVD
ncbi:MAG: glycosyltransferase [candidate division Zixibacteria bacterium]|nr:glycosyltransferase [candidate division Zixibacteria bacterium]